MIGTVLKPQLLWPTPTLAVELENAPELNQGLTRIILEKEREITSKGKPTKVAGVKDGLTAHWLEFNVLTWEYPEIKEFRRIVLGGLREFFKLIGDPDDPGLKVTGISCWANVLRFGEALDVHHHDPAFVSAHYTVRCGRDAKGEPVTEPNQKNGGETVYFRPGFMDRSQGGDAAAFPSPWDADWRISATPTEGKLFFFPSYVRHEVRPTLTGGERISIAMDVFVKKQEALIHFGPPRWFVP
ncbi:MAG TPA: putative 2OG-Fe(II) oxygenase [Blastocatellia bacterium]|nr:putative 2OG-Fe(II) oxygenase [Blastocatellia bacterium]